MAIVRLACRTGALPRRIVIDVIDNDEIEPPVAIEIQEGGRRAPEDAIEAGLAADMREGAVALVIEEPGHASCTKSSPFASVTSSNQGGTLASSAVEGTGVGRQPDRKATSESRKQA